VLNPGKPGNLTFSWHFQIIAKSRLTISFIAYYEYIKNQILRKFHDRE